MSVIKKNVISKEARLRNLLLMHVAEWIDASLAEDFSFAPSRIPTAALSK